MPNNELNETRDINDRISKELNDLRFLIKGGGNGQEEISSDDFLIHCTDKFSQFKGELITGPFEGKAKMVEGYAYYFEDEILDLYTTCFEGAKSKYLLNKDSLYDKILNVYNFFVGLKKANKNDFRATENASDLADIILEYPVKRLRISLFSDGIMMKRYSIKTKTLIDLNIEFNICDLVTLIKAKDPSFDEKKRIRKNTIEKINEEEKIQKENKPERIRHKERYDDKILINSTTGDAFDLDEQTDTYEEHEDEEFADYALRGSVDYDLPDSLGIKTDNINSKIDQYPFKKVISELQSYKPLGKNKIPKATTQEIPKKRHNDKVSKTFHVLKEKGSAEIQQLIQWSKRTKKIEIEDREILQSALPILEEYSKYGELPSDNLKMSEEIIDRVEKLFQIAERMGYQASEFGENRDTLPPEYQDQFKDFFKIEEQEGFEETGLLKTELEEKRVENLKKGFLLNHGFKITELEKNILLDKYQSETNFEELEKYFQRSRKSLIYMLDKKGISLYSNEFCERCGEPLEKIRLEVAPGTNRCQYCAAMSEPRGKSIPKEPSNSSEQNTIEIHHRLERGKKYKRRDLDEVLKTDRFSISREGIVSFKKKYIFLFCTLDKRNKEVEFKYNDYFNEHSFHWDSQNNQHLETPMIKKIINKELTVLLFCRMIEKHKGTSLPFIYCGTLEYEWHVPQQNKPVHIVFKCISYNTAETNVSLQELYKWKPANLKKELSSEATSKKEEVKSKKDEKEKIKFEVSINKDEVISEADSYSPSELKTLRQWLKSRGDFLQEHIDFLDMCIIKVEKNKSLSFSQASVLLEIIEQAKSKGLKYQRSKGFYWQKKGFWQKILGI